MYALEYLREHRLALTQLAIFPVTGSFCLVGAEPVSSFLAQLYSAKRRETRVVPARDSTIRPRHMVHTTSDQRLLLPSF
jgi:hypothetical protein